jgi:hypothetical protein
VVGLLFFGGGDTRQARFFWQNYSDEIFRRGARLKKMFSCTGRLTLRRINCIIGFRRFAKKSPTSKLMSGLLRWIGGGCEAHMTCLRS